MAKYRKTALIEATQFRADDPSTHGPAVYGAFGDGTEGYCIQTLEGNLRVTDGDWIATGVKGERWPIAADVFAATYEPVE